MSALSFVRRIAIGFILISSFVAAQTLRFNVHDTSAGVGTGQLVRADFNNDSIPDLAVVNLSSSTVTVQIMNGDGTFRSRQDFAVGQTPEGIAVGDFNHDHIIDLVTSNADPDQTHTISLLLGNGDGTFRSPSFLYGGTKPFAIVAADFNGDSHLDVATLFFTPSTFIPGGVSNQVLITLGDGKGGFSSQISLFGIGEVIAPGGPSRRVFKLATGDFNRDGRPDLAFTERGGEFDSDVGDVFVLLNTGSNDFVPKKVAELNVPVDLVRTDLDQDGLDDLIVAFSNSSQHGITYFRGQGDGTFEQRPVAAIVPAQFQKPTGLSAGDVNGDGLKDLLYYTFSFDNNRTQMGLVLQRPDSTFSAPIMLDSNLGRSGSGSSVAEDLDRDGRVDIGLAAADGLETMMNVTPTRGCPAPDRFRAVKFCLPLYSTVSSPIQVLANTRDALPIEAMKIYVDGVSKFFTTDDLLSGRISLPPGDHQMEVKAWDRLGPFAQTLNFTVATGCVLSGIDRTVKICTPAAGATLTSPVHIQATLSDTGNVTAAQIYVDGVLSWSTGFTHLVDTSLPIPSGSRRITVKGWDAAGAFSQTLNINVQ